MTPWTLIHLLSVAAETTRMVIYPMNTNQKDPATRTGLMTEETCLVLYNRTYRVLTARPGTQTLQHLSTLPKETLTVRSLVSTGFLQPQLQPRHLHRHRLHHRRHHRNPPMRIGGRPLENYGVQDREREEADHRLTCLPGTDKYLMGLR